MKKVGIITFHASHNYGSMLQAYALQQVVLNMGYQCEIINFRTKRQKQMFYPDYCKGTIFERMKKLIVQFPHIKEAWHKYILFEKFLQSDLILSEHEYGTIKELEQGKLDYDYYISGSDQIWNTDCFDFDIAYYLPFAHSGKLIAYAPSMGPTPEKSKSLNIDITHLLERYYKIGVREPDTANFIHKVFNGEVSTVIDPTLLLSPSHWQSLITTDSIIKGDYIFVYSPKFKSFEEGYKMAEDISERYKMKVVLSRNHKYLCEKRRWNRFVIKADIGPKEFINLIKNARLVCCDSFLAVVFSIIFQVPFLVIDGMEDSRISNLLKMARLENRSIKSNQDFDDAIFEPLSFKHMEILQPYIGRSFDFLKSALS